MRLRNLQPRIQTVGASKVPHSWRDDKRTANARGYTYRWQQESKAFLEKHPLCMCEDCDDGRKRVRVATLVDHRNPHRGDDRLFWDRSNWQAMAKECHDRKTSGGA